MITSPPERVSSGVERVSRWLLYASLLAVIAVSVHTFFAYIEHYPYWSIDDGLGVISTAWLQIGRYGDPSVPVESYSGFQRYRGFFLYGPWPFAAGSLVTWLVGFSVQALRSLHLLAALSLILVGHRLLTGLRGAVATTLVGVCVSYAVVAIQWPMVRPDPFVTLFAAALIWQAAGAMRQPQAWSWFACGLAAGCGALSHLLGATLVPASLLMLLGGFVIRARVEAAAVDVRRVAAHGAQLAAGWAVAALMFYGSFGFRFSDHLLHVLKYRSEVTANTQAALSSTSPIVVWAEHYRIAASGVPTFAILMIAAGVILAMGLLVHALVRRPPSAIDTVALLLPGVSVLLLYVTSIGFYPNFHTGYMMLPQLLSVWVSGAALYVGLGQVPRGALRAVVMAIAVAGVLTLALRTAGGLLRVDDDPRLALARAWVGIGTYITEVLSPLPEGAIAWGSAPLAVPGPARVQLVSLDSALWLMTRIPADRRRGLAPDYLLWGHPASMSAVVTPFTAPDDNPLVALPKVLPDQRFSLGAIVAAAPYGATRTYRRQTDSVSATALPSVSVWDAGQQRWMRQVDRVEASWRPAAGALQIAKGSRRWTRAATAGMSAELPEGWYLVKVTLDGESPEGVLVTAGAGNEHSFSAGDLPSELDIAARLSPTDPVYLLRHHTSGNLGFNVYAGSNVHISAIDTFAVTGWPDYQLDRDAIASQPLPPLSAWAADASSGVRVALDGDRARVTGNASQYGYQLSSPPIPVTPGAKVSVQLPVSALSGSVCVGVLDEHQQTWVVSPTDRDAVHRFATGTNHSVVIVVSNCNTTVTPPTVFVVEPGRYSVQSSPWYVDSLMDAFERAKQ